MADVADETRNPTADLVARAGAAPGEAEFFQTVREIMRAARHAGKAGLGGDERLGLEPVRFRAAVGMRFPSAEIIETETRDGEVPEITVAFMGLTGPSGVLPDHYDDLVVQRRRARDPALADFLDLFNHRSISLFYRAWAKNRLPVRYEEATTAFGDPFSRALASVIGLGLDAQRPLAALGGGGLLGLAGTLGRKTRSPGAIQRLVSALLGLPVAITEFHGRWIDIAPSECTRLAAPAPGERAYAQLGSDAVVGVRAWDVQGRFRIRLGPIGLADFQSFFEPDGPRNLLNRVVTEVMGTAVDFDLQLILKADDVPAITLGTGDTMTRLGQTTWLGEPEVKRDRDEAVLTRQMSGRL